MVETLAQQMQWFAVAVLLGIGFGAFFCAESGLGRLLHVRRTGQLGLDVCGALLCAAVSFLYFLTFRDGVLSGYALLGMAGGAGIWFGICRVCRAAMRKFCATRRFAQKTRKKNKKI